MAGAIIGGLLGAAFGETLLGWGLVKSAGLGWLFGASVGSLFDQPSIDFCGSSPNYAFSEIYNTKSQLLPVPICYGRVRVGGNIFMQQFYDDKRKKMDMFVGLGRGPINRVISVYANEYVLFGDGSDTQTYWMLVGGEWVEGTYAEYLAFEGQKQIRDADGENPVTVDLQECSCDVHLGEATQLKDDREPGEYTYPGVAYLGITLKIQEGLTGNPTITTELEGRKVWTPAGTRYTANPVWCIWDLLTDTVYGAGIPAGQFNLAAAQDAAQYCDQLVSGRPRYSLNYIIDQQRPAPDILRDMCMCFDGYFRERETIDICVNRPVSAPARSINLNESAIEGSFTWWQKGREETYNRIVIEWVDPDNHYERTSTPFEDQTDIIRRGVYERNISLLGVTDSYQAARLGEQALNIAQGIRNFCSFQVSVRDWDLEVGDVVSVTETMLAGWTNKWFHVIEQHDDPGSETATVTLVEYASDSYVDVPSQIPTPIDNPNPPPTPDNYSNLLLTDIGTQQEDGTYVPRIRVRFTPPSADMKEHVINWWHDEESVIEKKVSPSVTDVLISEGIRTGVTLTVRVWGTDVNGKKRTGVIGQIVPGRDDIAPGPPTGLTATGWFGEIILNWVNPETNEDGSPCVDLAYVEVWESSRNDVETAVLVGQVNGTNFRRHLGSFEGRYYWVRAVDTSGNISQWNDLAGTYGYSDQESHEDFVRELLGESETAEAIEDLRQGIDSLAESVISDLLASARSSMAASLAERKAQKQAELEILGVLSDFDDYVWSLASITEERNARETEDEALAEWIREVAAIIGDPENPGAGTVYAAVREEMRARAREDEALAQNITTLSAIIGDPGNPGIGTVYAALRTEQEARAAADETLAREVTTLAAGIGDPADPESGSVYAAIAAEASARAAADSALAQQSTTVQTQVGQNLASIQQLMSSVDGIKAKWAVRLDVNGRVAGLELIGTGDRASMVFLVDTFMVGKPGASGAADFPFVIGTVNGVTKVSISNAFIQDAAIGSAKIADLTIGRIKLASGVDAGLSWGDSTYMNWDIYEYNIGTAWFTPEGGTVTVPTESRGRVLVNAFVRGLAGGQFVYGRIQRNGVTVADMGIFSNQSALIANYMDKNPGNGNTTYRVQIRCSASPGHGYLWGCGISATVFYR